jgi:hypothetical protein
MQIRLKGLFDSMLDRTSSFYHEDEKRAEEEPAKDIPTAPETYEKSTTTATVQPKPAKIHPEPEEELTKSRTLSRSLYLRLLEASSGPQILVCPNSESPCGEHLRA